MKVCIIDLETTGTDASRHEIIEIGAVIFDSSSPGTVLHTIDMRVKPKHVETGDPGAFKVNGYVKEVLLGMAIPPSKGYCEELLDSLRDKLTK